MRLHSLSLVLALTLSLLAACSGTSSEASAPDAGSANMAAPEGAKSVVSGTFSGRNDHVVTGGVQVLEMDGRMYVRLDEAFSLDNAPDPKIGFGRSGAYDEATTFTPLQKMTGTQDYALPEGFELGTLNEAYIWCEKFSVALGVAGLK